MTYSFAQLLDTFPEAVPTAKRAAKLRIKQLNHDISTLSDLRDVWTADIQKLKFNLQPAYIAYLNEYIDRLREGYEKEIKKAEYQLSYISNLGAPKPEGKRDDIDDLRVARAKSYPVTDLLELHRGGVTLCLWHDDHKPSMKIYQRENKVYCFACAHGGDSIDIYMALNGCDFRTAVRALAP